jgi:hypothetical protein
LAGLRECLKLAPVSVGARTSHQKFEASICAEIVILSTNTLESRLDEVFMSASSRACVWNYWDHWVYPYFLWQDSSGSEVWWPIPLLRCAIVLQSFRVGLSDHVVDFPVKDTMVRTTYFEYLHKTKSLLYG